MKRKWITMAAIATAVCGLAGVARAVPIVGDITFAGGVTLNTSSAGTATEVLSWTGPGGTGMPIVISDDGSFSGIAGGTTGTFASPWSFDSGPLNGLWSIDGFTFDLTSSHIVYQGGNPAGVLVDGIGVISGNGYTAEAMDFSFSTSDPSAAGIFSFQVAAGTTGSVPDGGTTAMLLGMGILGLGLLKKHMLA